MQTIAREPVVLSGLIIAAVQAIILLAVGMGWWNLSQTQITLWMGATTALIALGVFILRRYVTPLNSPQDEQGRKLVPRE